MTFSTKERVTEKKAMIFITFWLGGASISAAAPDDVKNVVEITYLSRKFSAKCELRAVLLNGNVIFNRPSRIFSVISRKKLVDNQVELSETHISPQNYAQTRN